VLLLTMASTVYLYIVIPKGFFPQQDTGFITGVSEAAQDISFSAMVDRQQALAAILAADPISPAHLGGGRTGGSQVTKHGPLLHQSEATRRAPLERRPDHQPAARQDRPVEGVALFLQASQDINVGGRASRTQYQYTIEDKPISTS